jgi:hypothetical protein
LYILQNNFFYPNLLASHSILVCLDSVINWLHSRNIRKLDMKLVSSSYLFAIRYWNQKLRNIWWFDADYLSNRESCQKNINLEIFDFLIHFWMISTEYKYIWFILISFDVKGTWTRLKKNIFQFPHFRLGKTKASNMWQKYLIKNVRKWQWVIDAPEKNHRLKVW